MCWLDLWATMDVVYGDEEDRDITAEGQSISEVERDGAAYDDRESPSYRTFCNSTVDSPATSRWLPPVFVREPEGVGYDQGEQWLDDVMLWIQPPVVVVTGAERHRQAMVLLPLCEVL